MGSATGHDGWCPATVGDRAGLPDVGTPHTASILPNDDGASPYVNISRRASNAAENELRERRKEKTGNTTRTVPQPKREFDLSRLRALYDTFFGLFHIISNTET